MIDRRSGGHAQALLRTSVTGFRALLAMPHFVLLAFLGAHMADFRAILANQIDEFAVAHHEFGREPAKRGAIDIEGDATRHASRIGFLAAFGGAMVAGVRAGLAGIDAGLVMCVTHETS
jgi:hypothetical protein